MTCLEENGAHILDAGSEQDASYGDVRVEYIQSGFCDQQIRIGPDDEIETHGVGSYVTYKFPSCDNDLSVYFDVFYSDEVGGNVFDVMLDDEWFGSFETETTGSWETFQTLPEPLFVTDSLSIGEHTLKLEMKVGGSRGAILDCIYVIGV
jgi:hypothetical protein